MTIFALTGESGSGKTWYRQHNKDMKSLPYIDVAGIYAEFPGIDWLIAFNIVLERMGEILKDKPDIVVEAYFRPTSLQRQMLIDFAGKAHQKLVWVNFKESYDVCRERVLKDPNIKSRAARLSLLEMARLQGRVR